MKTWRIKCVVLSRIIDQIKDAVTVNKQEKWSNEEAKEKSVNWSKYF